ncbi:MAG: phosphatidate cytidylyltransferase [Bacteroidota bacterium]
MKTLLLRSLTGLVFVALVVGSVLWDHIAFVCVFGFFTFVSLFEYARLREKTNGLKFQWHSIISGMLIYVAFYLNSLLFTEIPLLIVPAKVSPLFTEIIFSITYIALPFSLLQVMPFIPVTIHFSFPVALCLFILIWTYDTFAYLTGMLFGRHKLAEKISPKKTWEGVIGGALFCFASAYILSLYVPELTIALWFVFAVITIIAGTIGDLFESVLKRKADVKDSGAILPGHGGILDRFDAVLFIVPFVFLFLSFIKC